MRALRKLMTHAGILVGCFIGGVDFGCSIVGKPVETAQVAPVLTVVNNAKG